LTPLQKRQQINDAAQGLKGLADAIQNFAMSGDRSALNKSAQQMVGTMEQLIQGCRNAKAIGIDPQGRMLEASKGVTDALKKLIAAAQNAAAKPNDPEAKAQLAKAQMLAQAAIQKLQAATQGVFADEGFQQLFNEFSKQIKAESDEMVRLADAAEGSITDPQRKAMLLGAKKQLASNADQLIEVSTVLAPVAQDTESKRMLDNCGHAVETSASGLIATARAAGTDAATLQRLQQSQARIAEALKALMEVTELPIMSDNKEAADFTEAAQQILASTANLMACEGNGEMVKQQADLLRNAVGRLGLAGKGIIAGMDGPMKDRMGNYLKNVVEATKACLSAAGPAQANPSDKMAYGRLKEAAATVADHTQQLIGDAGRQIALSSLYSAAKVAAAATTNLCQTSTTATLSPSTDPQAASDLQQQTAIAAQAVRNLVEHLKNAVPIGEKVARRSHVNMKGKAVSLSVQINDDLMNSCEQFAPQAYKLVSAAKGASSKVGDGEIKSGLTYSSTQCAKAIHAMLANRKALKAVKSQLESGEAMEEFKGALADLEAAMIAAETGILSPTKGKDEALAEMAQSIARLGKASKTVVNAAKQSPEELGQALKELSGAAVLTVRATQEVAANLPDKNQQKNLMHTLKGTMQALTPLIQLAKASATNPDDQNLQKLLLDAGKDVVASLVKLTEASKGIVPKKIEDHMAKSSQDIEDLAEKELRGCSSAIEACVAKIQKAREDAHNRMQAKEIAVDEQQITEAILEAAQAIAKSTGVLVIAATAVQQEYRKLAGDTANPTNVYKRDPQWAQGLISAAKTVAGSVQHLVSAANDAAQGNATEEALIVAARAVAAATTQLVTASTVKSDPNSQSAQRLKDAAKQVAGSTEALVTAARDAAKWEEDQANNESDQYALSNNQIQKMEQQMEILRLQKQLEMAQRKLQGINKADYEATTDPNFKPSGPAPGKAAPTPATPVAAGGNPSVPKPLPRGAVQWKTNKVQT